jgi:enoyl-CoA hydratase/carnithine racemase
VLWIVIDRPQARNALSFAMWDRLGEIVRESSADSTLRGVVIAGGPEAFAAGADIAEFKAFRDAEDGFAYEARVEAVLRAIEDLPVAGVPIARTLGNVTTVANARRLGALIGLGRVKEWFMTARLLDAPGALTAGFVSEVVPAYADLAPRAQALAEELAGFAPRTLRASKELYRRILRAGDPIDERDILASCYTSADFHEGVAAFFEKRRPNWRDR